MDLSARIQQLEELVREAKSMPLSSSALVNREEVLELIQGLRQTLPEEIKQARWVVKDREELLVKARRDAESLVERARHEQSRLLAHEDIVIRAAEEAERLLADAREQARQIRLEAEDYVDAKLAQFEIALAKTQEDVARTLAQVEKGREKLRGMTVAEEGLGESQEGAR
jgi:hypothetical protein